MKSGGRLSGRQSNGNVRVVSMQSCSTLFYLLRLLLVKQMVSSLERNAYIQIKENISGLSYGDAEQLTWDLYNHNSSGWGGGPPNLMEHIPKISCLVGKQETRAAADSSRRETRPIVGTPNACQIKQRPITVMAAYATEQIIYESQMTTRWFQTI